ncbi:unnamed protein product [Parajaminaea phylloscopi]
MSHHGLSIAARHIQNFTGATNLEGHWGYAARVLPCTSGAGTCAYLDEVYHNHDLGMLYVGIFWATVASIFALWAIGRQVSKARARPSGPGYRQVRTSEKGTEAQQDLPQRGTALLALPGWLSSVNRRYLLPRNPLPSVFGNASRLQLVILAVLAGYLTIWTFLGMSYSKWITPVAKAPGKYNTRTSLGPFADRVGVLAYALLPLSILLSSRESILSLMTGVPYQHFNFLHRWIGHIILIQASVHTIGWCIIEIRLYQPQPSVGLEWIRETYIVWGVIAMGLLLALWLLALPFAIKRTGYEFFRKAHYVLALIFIAACWLHWKRLECFLIPSVVVWALDRAIRLFRTFLLHYHASDLANTDGKTTSYFNLGSAKAKVRMFPSSIAGEGDIVRLDFEHPNPAGTWKVGQHFFLTFPESSIWQSHPFTSSSLPDGLKHCYIFRAKGGETKKVAEIARDKIGRLGDLDRKGKKITDERVSVVLSGPYGQDITEPCTDTEDVLCVAGGTGITFVLPVLMHLANNAAVDPRDHQRRYKLVWVIRHQDDVAWLSEELEALHRTGVVTISIYVTRDGQDCHCENTSPSNQKVRASESRIDSQTTAEAEKEESTTESSAASVVSASSILRGCSRSARPDLFAVVPSFVAESTLRKVRVYASGPTGMLNDLRRVVANCNPGAKQAWTEAHPPKISLICDDRLEL